MRHLHTDSKCPVCKSVNETLIVDVDVPSVDSNSSMVHHKKFEDYHLWGNDLGSGFVCREDAGMHFPTGM